MSDSEHVFECSQDTVCSQKPSKKRKYFETVSTTDHDTTLSQDDEVTFKPQTTLDETEWTEADNDIHIWLKKDVEQLMFNMEVAILELDEGSRSCIRLEKVIDWEIIKFGNYSSEECQNMWSKIQKKVKRFRTMYEFFLHANQLVSQDVTSFLRCQKSCTAEEIYIHKKMEGYMEKDTETTKLEAIEILKDKFQNISERRKEKYITKAKEMKTTVLKLRKKNDFPKAPRPVDLYVESKLQATLDKHAELTEYQGLLNCRKKYRKLKDSRKIKYINRSIQKFPEYQKIFNDYLQSHPKREVINSSYLSKDEVLIKLKHEGFPIKPPPVGYNLFMKEWLDTDDFKKDVPNFTRFKFISQKWNDLDPEIKKDYKIRCKEMHEIYKKDIIEKLLSVSEDERELLSQTIHLPSLESLDVETKRKKTNITGFRLITDFMKPKVKINQNDDDVDFQGEPKRNAMNQYAFYTQDNFHKISGFKSEEKLKVLAERWRELPEHEKLKYSIKVAIAKEEYQNKLTSFKESLNHIDLASFESIMENRKKKKKKKEKKEKKVKVVKIQQAEEMNLDESD